MAASIASVISATPISTVAVFIACFPVVVVRYVYDHDRQPADRLGNNIVCHVPSTSIRPGARAQYYRRISPRKAGWSTWYRTCVMSVRTIGERCIAGHRSHTATALNACLLKT